MAAPPSAPAQARGPHAPPVVGEREEAVALTPLRKRIAERLVEAQHTAAILTTFNEVDMTAVMALRAKYQDAFVARYGIKLGFMSFFVRACVESLKLYRGVNAEIRGDYVIYKKHYDFGIAVGGGQGAGGAGGAQRGPALARRHREGDRAPGRQGARTTR